MVTPVSSMFQPDSGPKPHLSAFSRLLKKLLTVNWLKLSHTLNKRGFWRTDGNVTFMPFHETVSPI